MCLCPAQFGRRERLLRKLSSSYTPLQIGFMNNGEIKAADVEYYINGGCTPDESEMVNTPSVGAGEPVVLTLAAQTLVLQLTGSAKGLS